VEHRLSRHPKGWTLQRWRVAHPPPVVRRQAQPLVVHRPTARRRLDLHLLALLLAGNAGAGRG